MEPNASPIELHTGDDISLEIGGGTIPKPGYINVDPAHGDTVVIDGIEAECKQYLGTDDLIFASETVARVRASHVMEHIPAGEPRIKAMNDVWEALVPHGTFEIRVPLFTGTWHALADPTHVSLWIPESIGYFTGELAANASYGIKRWILVGYMITDPDLSGVDWEGTFVLRKPKGEEMKLNSAFMPPDKIQ